MTAVRSPLTRVVVFGAIAAQSPAVGRALSPAARAVLEGVLASIASQSPAIARPILDRAVEEGTITRRERHALLRELAGPSAAEPPASVGARRVLGEALAAIRRAAPGIAKPILDEAVGAERLTMAQEKRILERLRTTPSRMLAGAPRARLASGVS